MTWYGWGWEWIIGIVLFLVLVCILVVVVARPHTHPSAQHRTRRRVTTARNHHGPVRTPYVTGQCAQIPQPIPFGHRHHVVDDGIDCLDCHEDAERSPHGRAAHGVVHQLPQPDLKREPADRADVAKPSRQRPSTFRHAARPQAAEPVVAHHFGQRLKDAFSSLLVHP